MGIDGLSFQIVQVGNASQLVNGLKVRTNQTEWPKIGSKVRKSNEPPGVFGSVIDAHLTFTK
jgi:hypothetical protein